LSLYSRKSELKTKSRAKRALRYCAGLAVGAVLVALFHIPLLRIIGSFLVVEDSLRPAAVIVVLGGQSPFREMEAARLFSQAWAPKVMLIPGPIREEQDALSELGFKITEGWEISRHVLLKIGVPPSAIIVPEGRADGTVEELKLVADATAADGKPIILVSSKYHTRRVRLTWNAVNGVESSAIVRAASRDPFDPARWWRERRFALSVVREYLGIVHVYAGFPVPPNGESLR
jgi:uncharacterized SAM-binding protein YcdF (DUF218 family)